MIDHHLDYAIREGKEYLKTLKGEKADCLRDYIRNLTDHIKAQDKHMKEMQAVFDGIAKFTNKGPTIYG